IKDVTGISVLTNLTELAFVDCIYHILSKSTSNEILQLTNLTILKLSCLQNVDGFSKLSNLTTLDLSNSYFLNLDGISESTNLTELSLQSCKIQNLERISNLTNLNTL